MSLSESGLSAQYKTLAAKKLGRIQTLPLPNKKLKKDHKSGEEPGKLAIQSHEMICPVANLQNISKAQDLRCTETSPKAHNLTTANSWRSSEGAECGQESKALKKQ